MATPNPFDQFDAPQGQANPFDQFDQPQAPQQDPGLNYSADGRVLGVKRKEGESLWDYTKRQFSHASQEPLGQSLKRQAGEVISNAAAPIRGGIDAINAIPVLAQDLGVGARNLLTGSDYQLPSQMYEQSLNQALPIPDVPGSNTVRLGTSIVGGGFLPSPTKLSPSTQLAPEGFKTAKQAASAVQQDAARRAIEEGKKRGVPVYADDVIGNPLLRKASVASENIPLIGTAGGRVTQNTAAQNAVKEAVDASMPIGADDIPVAIQQSMGRRLGAFKEAAGKLYDRVAQRLDPAGSVPTPTLAKTIDQKIAEEAKLGSVGNKEVIALLQKYKDAPQGNFTLMREVRSQLGNDISDFYTGANKTIGAKGVGSLQAIKNALEADMQNFASAQGPDSAKMWRAADSFYKNNIAQFKEAGFRELAKTTEPEKVWRYLVSQGSLQSRADKLYSTLDAQGKQAVRYGLAKEAQDAATTSQGVFSPAKFAKYLEDHDNAINTFFKGRDLQEINGLQTLMRTVERAGQVAENPPTGQRVIPFLIGGAAFKAPTATAVGAGGVYGFTKLLQTEAGRNLLLMMSKNSPGSEGAQRVAASVAKYLSQGTAVANERAQ